MTRPAPTLDLDAGERRRACEGWQAPDRKRVGRRLIELRVNRLWHERELAAWHLGVDVASLRAWEEGRWLPGAEALARLAWVYGVTTDWILKGE